jgi:hypothetical protein
MLCFVTPKKRTDYIIGLLACGGQWTVNRNAGKIGRFQSWSHGSRRKVTRPPAVLRVYRETRLDSRDRARFPFIFRYDMSCAFAFTSWKRSKQIGHQDIIKGVLGTNLKVNEKHGLDP